MKSGQLRTRWEGQHVYVRREDVETLVEELEKLPPINQKSFFRLVAMVQRLETDVALLKKMQGLPGTPLRPQPDQATALRHQARLAAENKNGWSIEEFESWVDLFSRIDELFFDLVGEATADPEPWRPFYGLCKLLLRAVEMQPNLSHDLRLQRLRLELLESLRRLRSIALVWIEAGRTRDSQALTAVEPETALLKRLEAKKA